jgi:hypothetical protein
MQTLELNKPSGQTKSANQPKNKFWKRQFQAQPTNAQKIFDWIVGVGLPVICFVFDPIVFKTSDLGNPLFGTFKPFAYLLSFVSIMAMAAFLIWGAKLNWLNGFLAGLFLCGGIVSFIVGLILFPFSVIGLFLLIGILGFTPLFSSFVYFRNGFRALQTAKPFLEKSVLIYSVIFGALFSVVVPAVVNIDINRSLENIKHGDAQNVQEESLKLWIAAPLVNTEELFITYRYTSEYTSAGAEKREAIAALYKDMTGEEIENKLRKVMD